MNGPTRRPAWLRIAWWWLWPAPWTLLGLALAALALCGGARARWLEGTLEVAGGALARAVARHAPRGIVAVTLGPVILGRDAQVLAAMRAHERVHVAQYARLGPLFLPAYAAASLWVWLAGRDAYLDNVFEREARSRCGR